MAVPLPAVTVIPPEPAAVILELRLTPVIPTKLTVPDVKLITPESVNVPAILAVTFPAPVTASFIVALVPN